MSSYAKNLEQRVISQNWISYWRKVGRMTYRRMYEPQTEEGQHRSQNVIGYEMVSNAVTPWQRRNNPALVNNEQWLFRAYHDGVGLYKKNLTHSLINRYPCHTDIDDVVFKHYYIDATLHDGDEYDYTDEILILRRKPLSQYASVMAEKENNLGDFLIRKYNLTQPKEVEA